MATEKTEVVIVGAGAAGGILAAELGKAGMKVIGLERGPRLTTQDFSPHDESSNFRIQLNGVLNRRCAPVLVLVGCRADISSRRRSHYPATTAKMNATAESPGSAAKPIDFGSLVATIRRVLAPPGRRTVKTEPLPVPAGLIHANSIMLECAPIRTSLASTPWQ